MSGFPSYGSGGLPSDLGAAVLVDIVVAGAFPLDDDATAAGGNLLRDVYGAWAAVLATDWLWDDELRP